MLSELYFPEDIRARYRCGSLDTARRYMRQMGAKGKPLFVTEEMIKNWELTRRRPVAVPKQKLPGGMKIPRRK